MAAHAIIDEAYAHGEFDIPDAPGVPGTKWYLEYGDHGTYNPFGAKVYSLAELSNWATGGYRDPVSENWDTFGFNKRTSELLGEEFQNPINASGWMFFLYGPNDEDTTAFNADGYCWMYFPDGALTGDSAIVVTYHVSSVVLSGSMEINDAVSTFLEAPYNPNIDYQVYHVEYYVSE
jgi:hypothetical protein